MRGHWYQALNKFLPHNLLSRSDTRLNFFLQIEPETLEQHLKDSLDVHFLKIQEALKRWQDTFGDEAASPQDKKTISERIEFIGRLLSEINKQLASGDVRPIVAVPVLKIIKLSLQSEKALNMNNDKMTILEGIITVFSRELEKLSEQVRYIIDKFPSQFQN